MKQLIIISAIVIGVILLIRGSIVYEGALVNLSQIWARAITNLTKGVDNVAK